MESWPLVARTAHLFLATVTHFGPQLQLKTSPNSAVSEQRPLTDAIRRPPRDRIEHIDYFIPASIIPFTIQLAIMALYCVTAVVALTGNTMSLIILLRRPTASSTMKKRSFRPSGPSPGGAHKIALRLYLINLAASDILMAVFSIPFTYTEFMYTRWLFYNWLCPIVRAIQLLAVHVSVYTLLAIGVDR